MNNRMNYNPDVLSCLANLSNDEVFTPPQLANQMLDMLPQELFRSPDTRFLDPCTKSGVFLREIAKRLIEGLADKIPDQQERIDHIMHHQLYGIAITRLTSMMSRRSLYCSKNASGKYSISQFDNEDGHIRYRDVRHSWVQGRSAEGRLQSKKCQYCGASQEVYDRGDDLESHAYEFIHTDNPKTLYKNMTFDVIIGNPPYQLNDGGGSGSSAIPIYHNFVIQAMKLNPRFLTMIIPSRWFTGGRGLDEFRDKMLNDKRISVLHDFPNASDCFPGVEIKGGVCFFLWKNNSSGLCHVFTHKNDEIIKSERPLLEKGASTFIRNIETIAILRKVQSFKEKSFSSIVSSNDPFGYDIRVSNSYKRIKPNYRTTPFKDAVHFYYNGWRKDGLGYISIDSVRKNKEWIDKYKVLFPKAWGIGDPTNDWLNPFIIEPNSVCTETYLVVGPFGSEEIAKNVISYTQTKFFHILVSIIKITQNTMQKAYSFVPLQDFSKPWTDEELYKKYGLTDEEIQFIESMIRPME